jgi:monoamine oxidase
VTVSTPVLADRKLGFVPPLDDKLEAAASLPLGLADKVFLELRGAEELEPDSQAIGNPRRSETGSYFLRPFGRPMIEAFFGGEAARMLEAEGRRGMVAFALEELVELFGSGIRRRLEPIAVSAWAKEPWICGSYSHALPGAADARRMLAGSVEDRIFFAGEACSPSDFSTAHGAYQSGVDAAESLLAVKGLSQRR